MTLKIFYRHDETTIVKTTVNATKEAVIEKLNECKKWHTVHCVSVIYLFKKFSSVLEMV